MNKTRRVSRLDKLIFFNYRRACEIGQVMRAWNADSDVYLSIEISR